VTTYTPTVLSSGHIQDVTIDHNITEFGQTGMLMHISS